MSRGLAARSSDNDIKQIIIASVMDRLSAAMVTSVEVEFPDDAFYGDVIFVKIVFDDAKIKLDPVKTMKLGTSLRLALINIDEDRFPVMTFVSKSDDAESLR